MPSYKRKCLVLIGAYGVGRRHIKSSLIEQYPDTFSYPLPYTSRQRRPNERNGQHFNFIPHEEMLVDIRQNKYLEYGSHDGALYGTRLNSIKEIIDTNKMPILDIEPTSIKTLVNTPEFAPLIIFIAAPLSLSSVHAETSAIVDENTLFALQEQSDDMYRKYRRYFDRIIINENPNDTIKNCLGQGRRNLGFKI